MLTVAAASAYTKLRRRRHPKLLEQVDDMNNSIITLLGAALLAAPAAAAPAPIHDRIADLCSVSNTDLEGQRLARACRAEVRARFEAERLAQAKPRQVRTAEAAPPRQR